MSNEDKLKELDNEWDEVRKRAGELAPDGHLPRENFELFQSEVTEKWQEITKKRLAIYEEMTEKNK